MSVCGAGTQPADRVCGSAQANIPSDWGVSSFPACGGVKPSPRKDKQAISPELLSPDGAAGSLGLTPSRTSFLP